jgi:[ribosomal protein S5]-alanine N-acetyltransferase
MVPLSARGPMLTLRYPEPEDAGALFALARDPEVTRFFSWSYEREEQAREWIAGRPASRTAGQWLEFVVEHRVHGVTGVTGLTEPSRRDRRAVTGTWLGRPFWGSGVNAEAKALLARLAFEACGLERLGAYAGVDNARSRRSLQKAGFTLEGRLRGYHRHAGRQLDVDVFGLLRAEWAAGPLTAVAATVEGEPPPAFRP